MNVKNMLLKIPMGVPYWDYRETFCIFKQLFNSNIDIQTEAANLEEKYTPYLGSDTALRLILAGRPLRCSQSYGAKKRRWSHPQTHCLAEVT